MDMIVVRGNIRKEKPSGSFFLKYRNGKYREKITWEKIEPILE